MSSAVTVLFQLCVDGFLADCLINSNFNRLRLIGQECHQLRLAHDKTRIAKNRQLAKDFRGSGCEIPPRAETTSPRHTTREEMHGGEEANFMLHARILRSKVCAIWSSDNGYACWYDAGPCWSLD
eukprot:jgi/Chlat1/906/Chrsp108S01418